MAVFVVLTLVVIEFPFVNAVAEFVMAGIASVIVAAIGVVVVVGA